MAGILFVSGVVLAFVGAVCGFCLDHEMMGVVIVTLALFCLWLGIGMAIGNEPEKCSCEETVQIETCEDCGGIIE